MILEELIDRLKNASKFEQAADLILQHLPKQDGKLAKKDLETALDCMLKSSRFLRAYHLCLEHAPSGGDGGSGILMNTVKTHVKIAFDIKRNQYLNILTEFEKRLLRLKVV